jgi:SAM-dependent methyltransferase
MTFEKTIDWDAFWCEASDREQMKASASGEHLLEILPPFFAAKGIPSSFADIGCGLGTITFEMAQRYPETTVIGYDAAESVLESNRERARVGGRVEQEDSNTTRAREPVVNVGFEQTVLPEFDPDREFEVIFSYCTLCYVAETDRALRNLYEAVEDGGYLILGYVSHHARRHFQERFGDSTPGSSLGQFDPVERFELVLDGETVLSYRRIHDVLGTWPRSIWSVVEKPDVQWAWENVPLVWVPK